MQEQAVLICKAHLFRLHPTPEQPVVLAQWVGAVRCAYNLALGQCREWHRSRRRLNFASQCREVAALRTEFDWRHDVPVHPMQQAVKDLDQAYRNWWAGRAHAPTPRRRGQHDVMCFPDPAALTFQRHSRRVGEVELPKLGWVRLRRNRAIAGEVKSTNVSRQAGTWQVAARYEHDILASKLSGLPAVGIDRGLIVFAALSDGTMIEPANHGKRALRALARAQRKLAQKNRSSTDRRTQARRVARLHRRVANARKAFPHKQSAIIARSHGLVVLDKLEVRNMIRSAAGTKEGPGTNVQAKSGLNRAILDQRWGMFIQFPIEKVAERGGMVDKMAARNSIREWSACALVNERSRNGERFRCMGHGHVEHADTNPAKVIKQRRDTALRPVKASDRRDVKAGISRRVA
jgi:putative transposase